MRIPAAKVPTELRRVAAQHLESLRGSGIGFNVDDLYLGDQVCPIYRPDMEGPAYFEFEILKATRAAPEERTDLVPDVGKVNLIGPGGYAKVYTSPAFPGALLATGWAGAWRGRCRSSSRSPRATTTTPCRTGAWRACR